MNKIARRTISKTIQVAGLGLAITALNATASFAENQISVFGGWMAMSEQVVIDSVSPFRSSTEADNIDLPGLNYGIRYTNWLGDGSLGLSLEYNARSIFLDQDLEKQSYASGGSLEIYDTTLSALKRFNTESSIQPYIGAGIGYRHVELIGGRLKDYTVLDFENSLVTSGFGGASYYLTDYFSVFSEVNTHYGFANSTSDDSNASDEMPGSFSASITLGASLSF